MGEISLTARHASVGSGLRADGLLLRGSGRRLRLARRALAPAAGSTFAFALALALLMFEALDALGALALAGGESACFGPARGVE